MKFDIMRRLEIRTQHRRNASISQLTWWMLLAAMLFPFSLVVDSQAAQKKFDKQIDAPFLEGLIAGKRPPKAKPVEPDAPIIFSPVAQPALSADDLMEKKLSKTPDGPETTDTKEKPEPETIVETSVDLAFGAYQRGYYLTALDLALPRAESGDPAAQTLIAELYQLGLGVGLNLKTAATWYKIAADGGNREAQFAYANMLIEGKTIKLDKVLAQQYMQKSAEAGHAKASFNLAQLIVSKRPDHAGFAEALPYYQIAAASELADAQYALANIYSTGVGVTYQDARIARQWMERAAIGGLNAARVELAIWMANGKGGPQNEEAALLWFKRAAAQGNAIAFNRLAKMYLFGIGTKSDRVVAASYHVLARRIGNRDAELERMFRDLEDIDKKRAIELANRWRKL